MHSSCDHFCHFIPIQFVRSWLGGALFENGLVSRAYVRFVEACKWDCGRGKIGLQSFITWFLQAAQRIAGENSFALWEEHSKCVGDCTDSDRDRFSAKGWLSSMDQYGQLQYQYYQLQHWYGQSRCWCGQIQSVGVLIRSVTVPILPDRFVWQGTSSTV